MRGCESQGGWLVGWLGFNGILSTQVAAISQGGGEDSARRTEGGVGFLGRGQR